METVKHGVLQMAQARKKVLALSEQYGLQIDPDAKISDISVGMQQRVEILKMLYRENDILIFDEPTAVLTPQEIDDLMEIIRELVDKGKSVIFISHKLNEIKQVANRCTVLRRGKCIGTIDVADATVEELSEMMVGRKVTLNIEKKPVQPGRCILSVRDLTVQIKDTKKNKVNHVSFEARAGEITCVAGVDNNGQTELVLAIVGMIPSSGQVLLDGTDVSEKTIRYRNTHGLAHIPEDRHKHGLVLDFSMAENIVLQSYFSDEFSKNGFLQFKKIDAYAEKLVEKFDIRSANDIRTVVRSMSGGNQQKIILAREITRDHSLLIAVQPTRGLDIGATEFIHRQLIKERDEGKAVLLISLELEEVMNFSDRILVMHDGEVVADVNPDNITMQELGLYMSGSKRRSAHE
jgi:simple sugar transport system ATP-binding protein